MSERIDTVNTGGTAVEWGDDWADALERRMSARRRRRRTARIATRKGSYAARVQDLSPDGAFIETHAALAPGDPVLLEVSTNRGPVRARAAVVHRRAVPRSLEGMAVPGVGLRFEEAADLWAAVLAEGRVQRR